MKEILPENQAPQVVDSTDWLAIDKAIVEILKNFKGKATAARVYVKIKLEHPSLTSKEISESLKRISS
tara:strand:- start:170 stop:373 length:204 start_codon:yes stop_codon:yes gene_type:complete